MTTTKDNASALSKDNQCIATMLFVCCNCTLSKTFEKKIILLRIHVTSCLTRTGTHIMNYCTYIDTDLNIYYAVFHWTIYFTSKSCCWWCKNLPEYSICLFLNRITVYLCNYCLNMQIVSIRKRHNNILIIMSTRVHLRLAECVCRCCQSH